MAAPRILMAVCMGCLAPSVASAQAPSADETAALDLAPPESAMPDTDAPEPANMALQGMLEWALGHDSWRPHTFAGPPPSHARGRFSAAIYVDRPLTDQVRGVFADRIDIGWRAGEGTPDADAITHTLKEAYLSIGAKDAFLDVGRFNERIGVAYAYNPTDIARRYAVVARPSDDPALVRSDRLGKVGIRAQRLWPDGSVVAVVAPRLRRSPSGAVLSPYIERSNSDTQAWVRASRRFGEATQAEALVHYDPASGAAWGMNLSTLSGESTVIYAEALATREGSLAQRALAPRDPNAPFALPDVHDAYRLRASLGASITLTEKFSTALEWHYDGTAYDRQAWDTLANPQSVDQLRRYLQVRAYAVEAQDNLTRQYAFARAAWREPFGKDTALTAFTRANLADHSRYTWLQFARDLEHCSLTVTFAHAAGDRHTEFGDVPARTSLQVALSIAL
ncbi:hypothetical protein [Tahibacter amnicola]|uniref:Beta-barrel porin 2 n=1 Tax=Tahibacter amnicola TaxID=2976241 RepID=A0ABY6BCY4_9GAMM|nr:hypothetical protein [Tahibacter amnicola]UXI66190.1 hypothetical protein N4264_15685 [Tahibacter amnicola]